MKVEKNESSSTVGGNVNWCSLGNSMEVPQKIKNSILIRSSKSISEFFSLKKKKNKNTNSNMYAMFTAALFTIAKIQTPPKYPSTD